MPVIYHHLGFPYTDVDRFNRRDHRFIIFGLIPTVFTLYLGMVLAFSPIIDEFAYFVVGAPFAFVHLHYSMSPKYNMQNTDTIISVKIVDKTN
ncbi:MAG TPA: hypothetical protein VFI73_13445 [Candidatus Nitrosopolaris sp.]|nr:hypothetical protein [Candidatus Nitrosopolaris sp.]